MSRHGLTFRVGNVVTAWTEFEIFPDAADVTEPLFVDVVVQFRITHPGCPARISHIDGGEPAEGPEGEVLDVMAHDQWGGVFYQPLPISTPGRETRIGPRPCFSRRWITPVGERRAISRQPLTVRPQGLRALRGNPALMTKEHRTCCPPIPRTSPATRPVEWKP